LSHSRHETFWHRLVAASFQGDVTLIATRYYLFELNTAAYLAGM
jgi:hypothetical protein